MSPLTHERCSELLPGYLAEELDPEQRRLVEDHLEYCAQCSGERVGLSALRHETEGLTADERAALRGAVLGASMEEETERGLADESDAVVVPLGGRGARASKYLGIAALLAILAVGSLFVFRGGITGSDDSGDAGSTFGIADDSGGRAGEDAEEAPAAEPDPRRDGFRYAGDLRATYQSGRGQISEDDLDSLGQSALLTLREDKEAAPAESDEQTQFTDEGKRSNRRAPENWLERLAARAPDELAPDITACGRTALDELDRPGLATYATTATLEGTDVVILGFVTGARTPDRYAVFAFPLGDCTTILTSAGGPLD